MPRKFQRRSPARNTDEVALEMMKFSCDEGYGKGGTAGIRRERIEDGGRIRRRLIAIVRTLQNGDQQGKGESRELRSSHRRGQDHQPRRSGTWNSSGCYSFFFAALDFLGVDFLDGFLRRFSWPGAFFLAARLFLPRGFLGELGRLVFFTAAFFTVSFE